MHNIILVCTHHSDIGECNSDELYKIIKTIRPDVIFEELPQYLFDRFYKEESIPWEPPEVKSIKQYLKYYSTNQIPIDINPSDTLTIEEINYLFDTFRRYAVYSSLEEMQKRLISQKGYAFLNSKKNDELNERKKSLEISLIGFQANKHQLFRIHKLFYEEHHKRENAIVNNIYNYSESNNFDQALLLLGSGHRKSFYEKMRDHKCNKIKLSLTLYGS